MADEITISTILTCSNGDFSFDRRITSVKADQTAQGSVGGVQAIGTGAHEAIAVGDVSTEGWAIFRNLDGTNYIDIGIDVAAAFKPVIRLEAGEPAILRVSTDALYAQANTAECNLEYTILED